MPDRTIVKARIHPSIGVARVGNSDGWFLGPEVPWRVPAPPGGYKDKQGRLLRQGARFRVYGYDAAGEVVRELDLSNAEITWTVHVANKKAAWYDFNVAMDIPEAVPCQRRNANVTGGDRDKLAIDPGPRSISGRDQQGPRFDTGTFFDEAVYLGELRTDAAGNLIFLGGHGKSGTPFAQNPLSTFANNRGWYDDTSDGPVSARVVLAETGEEIPVDPAWVVTAPPNYAPDMIGVVTMYDVVYNTSLKSWLRQPDKPSFARDIYPLFARMVENQWVNKGFFVQFGWKAPLDFLEPSYLARLGKEGSEFKETRNQIFNSMRSPAFTPPTTNALALPPMYGDGMSRVPQNERQWLAVTKFQYWSLQQWAAGNFEADAASLASPPRFVDASAPVAEAVASAPFAEADAQFFRASARPPDPFDGVPLAERPHTLNQASLHFCLGGPFHPGCEMTWPMRISTMYYDAFRVRVRAPNDPVQDYGDTLTPDACMGPSGPLNENGPGDLTRWMAVPWQGDTASCLSGYDATYDEYLPTFWPARVPNQVLTRESYDQVMDPSQPIEARTAAFNRRDDWFRFLPRQYLVMINAFVQRYGDIGVIERREGPRDTAPGVFPEVFYVESRPTTPGQPQARRIEGLGASDKANTRQRGR